MTITCVHLGKPLEGANVRRQAHVDLLDAEPGVLGGEPDVGGRHEVHSAANAGRVDGADDGLLAALHLRELVLVPANLNRAQGLD